ncbi:MAG: Rieske (2Fe-2S) protein [Thermoleophilia bacterium]|nr:Rieske (2Fe-2S) protein [Thermoleophilia bacterium]
MRHVVCTVDELPPGSRKIIDVDGRSIGIFNIGGELKAIRNICPHHGAPLCIGDLSGTMLPSDPGVYIYGMENRVLRCPWHGYEFNIDTGRTLYDPNDLRVKMYPVEIEEGRVVIVA